MIDYNNPCVWDALKNCDQKIILYGMGNGADKVLNEFEKRGISCYGVMASDDFVRYQNFRGYTVKKMSDFEKEIGDFTVALCFASQLPCVMEYIKKVASKHPMLIPNVPVYGDEIIDDEYLNKHIDEYKKAYDLLADEKSREVFVGALNFLYSGKLEYQSNIESSKNEAFYNILRLSNEETYLDLGAYKGDTVEEFLHYTEDYTKIVAVEPNLKNHAKLEKYCENLKACHALNVGISNCDSKMTVRKNAGRQSTLSSTGDIEIKVMSVDSINDIYGDFSYIKVDIEGMEELMLKGAKQTLQHKPKLNLACYHKSSDLYALPLMINSLNKNYKIYLRKHPYIPCWDLNLYCI